MACYWSEKVKVKYGRVICSTLLMVLVVPMVGPAKEVNCTVDYKAFLGQHDMVWDRRAA